MMERGYIAAGVAGDPAFNKGSIRQQVGVLGTAHGTAGLLDLHHSKGVVSNDAGDSSMSAGLHVNLAPFTQPTNAMQSALMNLDISSSNFSKAMNFESISRGMDGDRHVEELQSDGEEEESLCEQVLDTSHDLFEQQQAREQSRLLDRFQQLRQWQQQQQNLLLQQQEHQLQTLQVEQQRLQVMMTRQRQQQWGSSSGNEMCQTMLDKSTAYETAKMSNKQSLVLHHSSLPQAIAQGSLQLTTARKHTTVGGPARYPGEKTPPKKNRPVPNLIPQPPTPEEYLENGNPNLDSDSATQESVGVSLDADIHDLPDFMSEECVSESSQPAIHSQPTRLYGPDLLQSELVHADPVPLVMNNHVQPGQLLVKPVSLHAGSQISHEHTEPDANKVLDFRNLDKLKEADRQVCMSDGESVEELEDEEQTADIENCAPTAFDDQPVGGIAARKKTFEELLEEELKKEEEKLQHQRHQTSIPKVQGKTFLRKGEGVSRFAIPPKREAKAPHQAKSKLPTDAITATNGDRVKSGMTIGKMGKMSSGKSTMAMKAMKQVTGTASSKSVQKIQLSTCMSKQPQEKAKKKKVPTATLR